MTTPTAPPGASSPERSPCLRCPRPARWPRSCIGASRWPWTRAACTAVDVSDVLADAALITLHDYYASRPSDVRRNLLLVMHAALTLAVDDPDAERIDRGHIELAIAEGTG